jgi:hypothetical protein
VIISDTNLELEVDVRLQGGVEHDFQSTRLKNGLLREIKDQPPDLGLHLDRWEARSKLNG